MHYAGIRKNPRANANPLRSLPLFQPASKVFAPSATDKLVGELRIALWAVAGWERQFTKARAALGKANGHNIAWRRKSQRDAMVSLNQIRTAMRANARKIAKLEAELLALAVPADRWADAAASAGRITTPLWTAHGPDAIRAGRFPACAARAGIAAPAPRLNQTMTGAPYVQFFEKSSRSAPPRGVPPKTE